jgi:hypothetical protein
VSVPHAGLDNDLQHFALFNYLVAVTPLTSVTLAYDVS